MTDGEPIKEEAKCEIPVFFMSNIMKALSELECEIWDNHIIKDKVHMQNIVLSIKAELISIDKQNREIITVDGLKYRRVYE